LAGVNWKPLVAAAGAGALVAGIFAFNSREGHYVTLALEGKGQGCSAWQAMHIDAHIKELTARKDRILAAQRLVETDPSGLEHYTTPYGSFWTPAGSRFILPFNLAEEAVGIYGHGAQQVQKGDIVLDCGANVGTFARFSLNYGARLVVAIEPAPDNIECLRRNFAPEIAAKRLVIYPKGVWDKDDFLDLLVDPNNQAADSFVIHREGAKALARVPLTTIDKLVEELKLPRVDYIKMDIEGAEVRAVAGARQTIARFHPRMSLSVYHEPDHPVEVPKGVRAAWPDVVIDCGPCARVDGSIRPDILYFHP
jgi:FkbM family methyltransferase